jgi:hypothetical protein
VKYIAQKGAEEGAGDGNAAGAPPPLVGEFLKATQTTEGAFNIEYK